jgi:hypothetical protein
MEQIEDPARVLVEEVLRTGLMLSNVLATILEDLPEDAFPGEEPAAVLVEMVVGSIRPLAEAAGATTVTQTVALLGALSDRVVADLRAARDASRR